MDARELVATLQAAIVQGDRRAPFRLTIFAVETYGGWRISQFHGSIPSGF